MNREVILRNAAWARANLHMQAGEFYACTPVEFHRVYEEFKLRQRRDDWSFAKLCHVVATSAGSKLNDPNNPQPADPLAIPFDFFAPWYVHKKRRARRQPFNDIVGTIRSVFETNEVRKQNGQ